MNFERVPQGHKDDLLACAIVADRMGHTDTASRFRAGALRIAELEAIIIAILEADERGQGVGYAEAMERAHKAVPRTR